MNGLDSRQVEGKSGFGTEHAWPSFGEALHILVLRWKLMTACLLAAVGVAVLFLRVVPKSYESLAVVTTSAADVKNPSLRSDDKFKVLEREKLALDELRSSLFSYDIVRKAAEESGINLSSGVSTMDHLTRLVWSSVGGQISLDTAARERMVMDLLRFKLFRFERLAAGSVQDRFTERDSNMFLVAMKYDDPQIAKLFLQRILELYREKLSTEQAEANEKLAKVYDELVGFFGEKVTSLEGDPKLAREKLQSLDLLKDQLRAKLAEATVARNNAEAEIAALRREVIDAETRYSDKHPIVESLRRKFSEGSAKARAPVGRIDGEVASIRGKLNDSFSELLQTSQGTFENSNAVSEAHSDQMTRSRKDLRSVSGVYETMKERYLQIIVQERISNMLSKNSLEIVEPASLPLRPVSPSLTKVMLLALVVGLGIGLLAVFAREILNPYVQNRWVLTLRTRLPLLGEQRSQLADAVAELGNAIGKLSLRHSSPLRRSLKRLASRGTRHGTSTSPREKSGGVDGLALLLTKLVREPKFQGRVYQCGLMPLAHQVHSVAVTFAIAKQLAAVTPGQASVVIVATQRRGGILDVVEVESVKAGNRIRMTEAGVAIYDASDLLLTDAISTELASMGYHHILWDFPGHEALAWRGLSLPQMPLIGVLEYNQVRYSDIEPTTEWLRLMASENGYTVGLFVTGSSTLPRVKLFDYLMDRVA